MRNNLGKVTLMISILLCFGGLTACESAKEKNISYVGDAANSLHIPDSYMEEWKVNKNTVKLAVEGVEYIPDSDFRIYEYKQIPNAAKQKQEIVEAVFEEEKGIFENRLENDYKNLCREDLETIHIYQEKIREYYLDQGQTSQAVSCDQEIENIIACEAGASDKRALIQNYEGQKYVGYIGDNLFLLTFKEENDCITGITLENYLGTAGLYTYYGMKTDDTITLENHLGDVTECIVDLENTVENRCAKDMDCARDEALLFLEACGITDVEILEEGPLGYSTFESARPIDFNGYCFQFTRAAGNRGAYIAETELFAPYPFCTSELFTVCVDDNGVMNAELYIAGVQAGEKAVTLMDFEDIEPKFAEQYEAFYAAYPGIDKTAAFNFMELDYMLVEGEKLGTFEYKPVWLVAYYEDLDTCYTYDYFYFPDSLLVIDAETGEYIDYLKQSCFRLYSSRVAVFHNCIDKVTF